MPTLLKSILLTAGVLGPALLLNLVIGSLLIPGDDLAWLRFYVSTTLGGFAGCVITYLIASE